MNYVLKGDKESVGNTIEGQSVEASGIWGVLMHSRPRRAQGEVLKFEGFGGFVVYSCT